MATTGRAVPRMGGVIGRIGTEHSLGVGSMPTSAQTQLENMPQTEEIERSRSENQTDQIKEPRRIKMLTFPTIRYKVIKTNGDICFIDAHDTILSYSGPEAQLRAHYKFIRYVLINDRSDRDTVAVAVFREADIESIIPSGTIHKKKKTTARRVKD